MSQVIKKGSLSIGPNVMYGDEQTIGGFKWQMFKTTSDGQLFTHRIKCLSRLDDGCSLTCRWTAMCDGVKFSGSHTFCNYSLCVQAFPIQFFHYRTSTSEFEILHEVLPIQFASPFGGVDSKDQEAIMALPMQERHAAMLNNPFMSDIAFKVGPDGQEVKFFGHKFLMATSSEVFRAMLMPEYPGLEVPEVIDIPDVHPTAFMTLLRFIYRDETVVELNLIQETLYVGEKYNVTGFSNSLQKYLGQKTVMEFLPLVGRVGPTHVLYEKCLSLVKGNLDIKKEGFLQLDPQVLHSLLKSDDIKVKEVDLFNAYVKWTDKQLQDKNTEINDGNRKKIMTDLSLIRFPIMTAEEFSLIISTVDVLTKEEIVEILGFITAKRRTKFITKKRAS